MAETRLGDEDWQFAVSCKDLKKLVLNKKKKGVIVVSPPRDFLKIEGFEFVQCTQTSEIVMMDMCKGESYSDSIATTNSENQPSMKTTSAKVGCCFHHQEGVPEKVTLERVDHIEVCLDAMNQHAPPGDRCKGNAHQSSSVEFETILIDWLTEAADIFLLLLLTLTEIVAVDVVSSCVSACVLQIVEETTQAETDMVPSALSVQRLWIELGEAFLPPHLNRLPILSLLLSGPRQAFSVIQACIPVSELQDLFRSKETPQTLEQDTIEFVPASGAASASVVVADREENLSSRSEIKLARFLGKDFRPMAISYKHYDAGFHSSTVQLSSAAIQAVEELSESHGYTHVWVDKAMIQDKTFGSGRCKWVEVGLTPYLCFPVVAVFTSQTEYFRRFWCVLEWFCGHFSEGVHAVVLCQLDRLERSAFATNLSEDDDHLSLVMHLLNSGRVKKGSLYDGLGSCPYHATYWQSTDRDDARIPDFASFAIADLMVSGFFDDKEIMYREDYEGILDWSRRLLARHRCGIDAATINHVIDQQEHLEDNHKLRGITRFFSATSMKALLYKGADPATVPCLPTFKRFALDSDVESFDEWINLPSNSSEVVEVSIVTQVEHLTLILSQFCIGSSTTKHLFFLCSADDQLVEILDVGRLWISNGSYGLSDIFEEKTDELRWTMCDEKLGLLESCEGFLVHLEDHFQIDFDFYECTWHRIAADLTKDYFYGSGLSTRWTRRLFNFIPDDSSDDDDA